MGVLRCDDEIGVYFEAKPITSRLLDTEEDFKRYIYEKHLHSPILSITGLF
jgi:hypothetical protein